MTKLSTRTVKSQWAPYMVQKTTGRGDEILVPRYGNKGDKVELLPADEARLDDLGALEPKGKAAPATPGPTKPPVTIDAATASDVELIAFIKDTEPTVPNTIALAGDDVELAKRVLAAESAATDGAPRAGVEKGLTKVIEAAPAT